MRLFTRDGTDPLPRPRLVRPSTGFVRIALHCQQLEDRLVPALAFTPPTAYGTNPFVQAVAAGDLTGDGYADFVVTDEDSELFTYINNGSGTGFTQLPQVYNLGSKQAKSIQLVDMDGDKFLDLVAVCDEAQTVVIMTGNGDGTFGATITLNKLPAKAYGLAITDLDGDKRPDIVTGTGDSIAIFTNDASGTVVNPTATLFKAANANFVAVTTADFDSDGVVDIAGSDDANSRLLILAKPATGTYSFSASVLDTKGKPSDIEASDFNNDGKFDLIFGAAQQSQVGVFLNTGVGGFNPAPLISKLPGTVLKLDVADFDADANNDVLVDYNNPNGFTVATLTGRGDGTFFAFQTHDALEFDINPVDVDVADFDLDQRPDWVAVNSRKNSAAIVREVDFVLNVTDLVATSFKIIAPTTTPTAGQQFTVTVQAITRKGVPVPNYTGTVAFTSDDPRAVLPADYTFTKADKGSHDFTLTFLKSGTDNLTVTDTANMLQTVSPILVSPDAAATFSITATGNATVGVPYSYTVSVFDKYGNVATGYQGRVNFTSSDPLAVLRTDAKVPLGSRSFDATFRTTGTQVITVTDSNNKTLTATSPPITVVPVTKNGIPPGSVPDEVGFPLPSLTTNIAASLNPAKMPLTAVGGPGRVRVYDPSGARLVTINTSGSAGTPRAVLADVNGDGVPDVISAASPGAAPQLSIYDGTSGQLLRVIDVFESAFTGGLYVVAGDVDGDGTPDAVITPDQGGGPRVRILNLVTGAVIADFFGIDDANFRGGARASLGDMNGDGRLDLLVAAGFGGGPRVAGYDGTTVGGRPIKMFSDFFVFEQSLRNGVFITSGDLNGDGVSDVIVGGGPGGGPRVFALSGKELLASGFQQQLANFFAGDVNLRGGVRVAVKDLDGDNRADIVTGAGAGSTGVQYYLGKDITPTIAPPATKAFSGFEDDITSGVFVG